MYQLHNIHVVVHVVVCVIVCVVVHVLLMLFVLLFGLIQLPLESMTLTKMTSSVMENSSFQVRKECIGSLCSYLLIYLFLLLHLLLILQVLKTMVGNNLTEKQLQEIAGLGLGAGDRSWA